LLRGASGRDPSFVIGLDSRWLLNYPIFGHDIMVYLEEFREQMLKRNDAGAGEIAPSVKTGKREKFVRLAESRTVNAIKAIRVIGKLGNKSAYEFSEADVKKIVGALTREIEALRARMTSSGGRETVDFRL
jgi:hypothetical protein